MMNHFSKWCEAFPAKDQKASTVANILLHKVFSCFGPPTVLHSEQGANFESNLMHELCDLMDIAKQEQVRITHNATDKYSAKTERYKICYKSLSQIMPMIGINGSIL